MEDTERINDKLIIFGDKFCSQSHRYNFLLFIIMIICNIMQDSILLVVLQLSIDRTTVGDNYKVHSTKVLTATAAAVYIRKLSLCPLLGSSCPPPAPAVAVQHWWLLTSCSIQTPAAFCSKTASGQPGLVLSLLFCVSISICRNMIKCWNSALTKGLKLTVHVFPNTDKDIVTPKWPGSLSSTPMFHSLSVLWQPGPGQLDGEYHYSTNTVTYKEFSSVRTPTDTRHDRTSHSQCCASVADYKLHCSGFKSAVKFA